MLTLSDAVRPATPEDVPDLIMLMRGLAELEGYIDGFMADGVRMKCPSPRPGQR